MHFLLYDNHAPHIVFFSGQCILRALRHTTNDYLPQSTLDPVQVQAHTHRRRRRRRRPLDRDSGRTMAAVKVQSIALY